MFRLILLILSTIIPIVVLLLYFKKLNRYHKSWPKVLIAFSTSLFLTILYGIFLTIFYHERHFENVYFGAFYSAFFEAAIPEELLKFAAFSISCYSFLKLQNELQGIIYGATTALGFALLENIMYVNEGGFGVALVRAIFSVPGHALFGVLMGYHFYKFYSKSGFKYLGYCLFFPIILHGTYDFMLMLDVNLFEKEAKLYVLFSQLILSSFILFVVMEFGFVIRLILTTSRNQKLQDINTNQVSPEHFKNIDRISVQSDQLLLHRTRQYVYIFSILLCLLMWLPFGLFFVIFLSRMIESFFKPQKVHRFLRQNVDDEV